MDVAVLAADLANLGADRDGHTLGLALANELRQLGRALVVGPLLLVEVGLREIHQGRGIDVDVVEARLQLFLDQRAQRLQLACGVGGIFLGVDLHVIALNEQRPLESLAQRGCRHHGDVLRGTLIGVGDFAAGDLADHRADIEALRRAKNRAPGVV